MRLRFRWALALFAILAVAFSVVSIIGRARPLGSSTLAANSDIDPGTPLGGVPAPDFLLVDQFGHQVSLHQFRGKAVVLAFVDSRCTTICPIFTSSMVQALQLLGPASADVQLLGVNANPEATAVADVRAYSDAHQISERWLFLTGSLSQLAEVWKAYHVYADAVAGQIDHAPAIYLIDAAGRERTIYIAQMAYAGGPQQAQLIADGLAPLLPGHPRPRQVVGLRYLPGVSPAAPVALPVAGGLERHSTVVLGPGRAHLVFFFAAWLAENTDVVSDLGALNQYVRQARRNGWPDLVAVDEATTEAPGALNSLLARLPAPLEYPVAVDPTGRVADGYGVADLPWFELVGPTGYVLFRHDGWLPPAALDDAIRRSCC